HRRRFPRRAPLRVASPPTAHTLSLHDALPIYRLKLLAVVGDAAAGAAEGEGGADHHRVADLAGDRQRLIEAARDLRLRSGEPDLDRKSTRLNSSHLVISYAVFCLKKKRNDIFS